VTRRAVPEAGEAPLHALISDFAPATLDACSALPVGRFDRKFVVPVRALGPLVESLRAVGPAGQGWRVLEVAQRRLVQYRTAYFDTPCLQLYRDHLQGRRQRYKIRTRQYCTGAHMLEVKLKGARGRTEKLRRARAEGAGGLRLDAAEHGWLRDGLRAQLGRSVPDALAVTAQTFYRRVCLVGAEGARLTIDLDFAVSRGAYPQAGTDAARVAADPELAIIECKSAQMNSELERRLRRIARRPERLSKYAVALALTHGVRGNPWIPALRRLGGAAHAHRSGAGADG